MTYDEFKQNFLPEFLKINSYAGRIRYANQNLERIGGGTGRIVYNIDDEKVLKLAKNARGVAQNEAEENSSDYYSNSIVAEVFDYDENYIWLISEQAKKVTEKRIKEVTGIPSLHDLFIFLSNTKDKNNGKEESLNQSKEMEEFFWENEFVVDLFNFIAGYNQSVGDMGKPSSYGEVVRNGEHLIVLTDYGLNDEVYNKYYNPKRKQKYQMYELYNFADGNDDILNDTGDQTVIRRGMWAQMPYSVSDGQGVINEKFVNFVKNRNKYPNESVSGIGLLADGFHECVNNIKETLKTVDDKEKFYNNLLELQNYLSNQGYYDRDKLLSEEYFINEETPDVEQYSLDDRTYADELARAVAIKLNLSSPRYLGGGGNGFAYEINNNLVLKLTSDVSEADAASKLLRGKPEYIATIFNLYKVHDTETDKSFFAILQENINDKPIEKFKKIQNDIDKISPNGMGYVDIMFSIKKPKRFDYEQMLEFAKQLLTTNPEANVSQQERQEAYEFLVGMINIRKELLDFDIKSVDYIENANLGYKDGVLKFFDTGGYRGVQEPNLNNDKLITLPEDATAKFTTDDAINQDGFPSYNTNDTSPSINNDLDANIAMYNEDLEYNHVKGDASNDEYVLGESDINLSKKEYQNITDDKILEYIKSINNLINQIKSKKYLSREDLTDLKFLTFSMNYNKNKYLEHMGFNYFNDVFKLFIKILKKNNIIKDDDSNKKLTENIPMYEDLIYNYIKEMMS
jgi:hypothetical protein